MQENERRQYLRGSHFHCDAMLSSGNNIWKKVDVYDLSSGGLKLRSNDEYATGDLLLFDLNIQGFLTEFSAKVEGVIRRKQAVADSYVYGIAFVGLNKELGVQIDENVQGDRPIEGNTYLPS